MSVGRLLNTLAIATKEAVLWLLMTTIAVLRRLLADLLMAKSSLRRLPAELSLMAIRLLGRLLRLLGLLVATVLLSLTLDMTVLSLLW